MKIIFERGNSDITRFAACEPLTSLMTRMGVWVARASPASLARSMTACRRTKRRAPGLGLPDVGELVREGVARLPALEQAVECLGHQLAIDLHRLALAGHHMGREQKLVDWKRRRSTAPGFGLREANRRLVIDPQGMTQHLQQPRCCRSAASHTSRRASTRDADRRTEARRSRSRRPVSRGPAAASGGGGLSPAVSPPACHATGERAEPRPQKNAPPLYSPKTSRIVPQTSPIDAPSRKASLIG